MATVKQIEETILKVAGDPTSGSLKSLAPIIARAIAELDAPLVEKVKEKRVVDSSEIR
jgi:hypothetical protein